VLVVIAVLATMAALLWLVKRRPAPTRRDDVDRDALDEAEREVRDLDVMTTPDEADDHLPDWGPGAPNP